MTATLSPVCLSFHPCSPLLPGRAAPACRASVIIPARDEAAALPACLDAFAKQTDTLGAPLGASVFEIVLMLNNCTDDSPAVARRWQVAHPEVGLHILERTLEPAQAHAGTARLLLMDTAWHRLGGLCAEGCAILSTDADSIVAPDWIAQNLAALARGADAVGGAIELKAGEYDALPEQVRRCYRRDRRYAELIARLEDLLDSQPGDPWPRHLDHFGSSLACTPAAYARAGGMPAVTPLEDEAFVDRLRRADLCLRHEPAVRVFTSARLDGRATLGLAGQLRSWGELPDEAAHMVPSAAYLAHRFRSLRQLREIFRKGSADGLPRRLQPWRDRMRCALLQEETIPGFLTAIDCDGLIAATFSGACKQRIDDAIRGLEAVLMSGHAGSPPAVASKVAS